MRKSSVAQDWIYFVRLYRVQMRNGCIVHLHCPRALREGEAGTHDMIAQIPFLDWGARQSTVDSSRSDTGESTTVQKRVVQISTAQGWIYFVRLRSGFTCAAARLPAAAWLCHSSPEFWMTPEFPDDWPSPREDIIADCQIAGLPANHVQQSLTART